MHELFQQAKNTFMECCYGNEEHTNTPQYFLYRMKPYKSPTIKITIAYRSSRANRSDNSKQKLWKECRLNRLNLLQKFFFEYHNSAMFEFVKKL